MVSIHLTERDFVAARMCVARRRRGLWLCEAVLLTYLAIVGAMLAFSTAIDPALHPAGYALLATVATALLIVAALFFLLTPWAARKRYRQDKLLQLPKKLSWTSQALISHGQHGTLILPWSDFAGYTENTSLILLYPSPTQCLYIPKHALPAAELTELQTLLRQHVHCQP
jgi:hypothetical protein